MNDLIKIENSSNLEAYFYEPLTKTLFLEFKGGGLYGYDLVPPELIEEFQIAPSKGAFFYSRIKDKFKCTKFRGANENPRAGEDKK